MHRLLSEILMDTQRGGELLFGSIKIAVLFIAKVFTMCFLGFLMSFEYVNILPASDGKVLNEDAHFLECVSSSSNDLSISVGSVPPSKNVIDLPNLDTVGDGETEEIPHQHRRHRLKVGVTSGEDEESRLAVEAFITKQ